MKTYACIYHDNCADGLAAAAAIAVLYGFNDVDFMPCSYGRGLPKELDLEIPGSQYSEIFVVDFSFPIEQLEELCKHAEVVHVWDHHKTAWEDLGNRKLPDNCSFKYFQYLSGAQITWNEISSRELYMPVKKDGAEETGNYLRGVNLVGDRDLWKFKHGDETRLFHMAVNCEILQIDDYTPEEKIERMLWFLKAPNATIAEGRIFKPLWDKLVNDAAKSAVRCTLIAFKDSKAVRIPVMSTYCHPMFASDVGSVLHAQNPEKIAMMLNVKGEKQSLSISLRRNQHTPDDVLIGADELARLNGGGGHKNAAGCEVSFADINRVEGTVGRWVIRGNIL